MTSTPVFASTHNPASAMSTARQLRGRTVRTAAVALLAGGPTCLALHVLWRIGHGPTVVNEHGVVLGLTNDEWSYLGPVWAVPVALALAVLMTQHSGWTARAAAVLTGSGLVIGAAAAWIWPLYTLGTMTLGVGLAFLSVTLWRGRVLSRWLALPPAGVVIALVPFAISSDAVYAAELTVASISVDLADLPVVAGAVTWTALGVALLRRG